jgi:hypothetical protein
MTEVERAILGLLKQRDDNRLPLEEATRATGLSALQLGWALANSRLIIASYQHYGATGEGVEAMNLLPINRKVISQSPIPRKSIAKPISEPPINKSPIAHRPKRK